MRLCVSATATEPLSAARRVAVCGRAAAVTSTLASLAHAVRLRASVGRHVLPTPTLLAFFARSGRVRAGILVLVATLQTALLACAVRRPRASDGIHAPATLPLCEAAGGRVCARAHVRVTDARRAHAVGRASSSVAHVLRFATHLLRLARFVRLEKVTIIAR